jgi:hypothetical protein
VPACGMLKLARLLGQVTYFAGPPATTTNPVPVTSAAPPVGLNEASAAHRSQNTVPAVLTPKLMLEIRTPKLGLGETTTAAQAVRDMGNNTVLDTPLSRPPGAVVVSTSTTEEFTA